MRYPSLGPRIGRLSDKVYSGVGYVVQHDQARIAANRAQQLSVRAGKTKPGRTKAIDVEPPSLEALIQQGGMWAIEEAVARRAAHEAVMAIRPHWLQQLESWRAICSKSDSEHGKFATGLLDDEIKRFLGERKPALSDDERRARIRERVHKHRARRR